MGRKFGAQRQKSNPTSWLNRISVRSTLGAAAGGGAQVVAADTTKTGLGAEAAPVGDESGDEARRQDGCENQWPVERYREPAVIAVGSPKDGSICGSSFHSNTTSEMDSHEVPVI